MVSKDDDMKPEVNELDMRRWWRVAAKETVLASPNSGARVRDNILLPCYCGCHTDGISHQWHINYILQTNQDYLPRPLYVAGILRNVMVTASRGADNEK